MQTSSGRTILVGEDELEVRGYLDIALKCLGYHVELAQDGDEVLSYLRSSRSQVRAVLLDVMMPNCDGLDALLKIRETDPDLPVIMVSGFASSMNIVTAMKYGATDFLSKPVTHDDLRNAINRSIGRNSSALPAPSPAAPGTSGVFLSNSPRMREIQSLITQIGSSEAPVLIQGETGSGKEVLARELAAHSRRADKPFHKLNCAALPSELVESELFGYVRGAFTGAFQTKTGIFEIADGGTILLDEIGDMDVRLQAKLLQVLQDGSFQRIGGKDTINVDVRIMAATHRDLEKCIADQSFREDLYYRLNVINIHLPPLRERGNDVVHLAKFLLQRHAEEGVPIPALTRRLEAALLTYHWPGNVRELENYVRRLLIFGDTDAIAQELHSKMARKPLAVVAPLARGQHAAALAAEAAPLDQVARTKQRAETDAILAALNATRWNRKRAALLLKIDYKALLYKMKKLGIEFGPKEAHPTAMSANGHPPDL